MAFHATLIQSAVNTGSKVSLVVVFINGRIQEDELFYARVFTPDLITHDDRLSSIELFLDVQVFSLLQQFPGIGKLNGHIIDRWKIKTFPFQKRLILSFLPPQIGPQLQDNIGLGISMSIEWHNNKNIYKYIRFWSFINSSYTSWSSYSWGSRYRQWDSCLCICWRRYGQVLFCSWPELHLGSTFILWNVLNWMCIRFVLSRYLSLSL